jgi:Tol biopolymer transport system component
MRIATIVLASALAIWVGAGGAPQAKATFPGNGGELAYSWIDVSGKVLYSSSGIDIFDAAMESSRLVFACSNDRGEGGEDDDCASGEASAAADGKRLAVVVTDYPLGASPPKPRHRLAIVRAAGDEIGSIPLAGPSSYPAWSPDGKRVLVTRYAGSDEGSGTVAPRLTAVDLESGEELPVAGEGASDADWSVRGEIVYVRDGDLWATTLDGPELRMTSAGGTSPSWSPDGKRLAFVRDGRIWEREGDRERQLSTLAADAPAWAPDGRQIAFLRSSGSPAGSNPRELWLMRADGRCAHLLRRPGPWGSYDSPFWRPSTEGHGAPRLRDLVCGREARPDLRRGKRRIHVAGRSFVYRFRATPGLEGWVALRTRTKALVPTRKGMRRRHLRFPQRRWDGPVKRRFEAGRRGAVTVTVRLLPRQVRILRLNDRLKLRVTAAVRDDAGDLVRAHKRLTLLAPRAPRRD